MNVKKWMYGPIIGVIALFLVLLVVPDPVTGMVSPRAFDDQPDTYSSSLSTKSGQPIYDWQLANMIKMWIADAGFANMVFIFNQCYAGGMMDDLKAKLTGMGDTAMMGAAQHDETSFGIPDNGFSNPAHAQWFNDRGFTKPEDTYAKEVGEEMARTGTDARTAKQMADQAAADDLKAPGNDWATNASQEHPQYTSTGSGDSIKLGKKTDGTDAASRHAILFAGDPDGIRHWNDMERARDALVAQGFPTGNITTLAGSGTGGTKPDGTPVPDWVNGAGTKKDLFDAIKALQGEMNANEQFVFWASDHGNRERTELALNRAITDTVKQTVPVSETQELWDLDSAFLQDLYIYPEGQPYVSLLLDSSFNIELMDYIHIYVNEQQLSVQEYGPLEAYDDDPLTDDGWELIFPIQDRSLLTSENLIELGWAESTPSFEQFTLLGLQISTGDIPEITSFPPAPVYYDFDKDNQTDILYRHPETGNIGTWLMNGYTEETWRYIANHGTSWDIGGVGDFNGDGYNDVIYSHSGGNVGLWTMKQTTETSWQLIGNHGTSWSVRGVGDFNGDGDNDIVYQHSNGNVGVWLMDGATESTWEYIGNHGASWEVRGVGDFNNDGRQDILYKNTNGKVGVWLMDGAAEKTWQYIGNHGASWDVRGLGDFNNDGYVDVLYRHTNGNVGAWLMNGATENAWQFIGNHGVWDIR